MHRKNVFVKNAAFPKMFTKGCAKKSQNMIGKPIVLIEAGMKRSL
jgi:hypothetical protein